MYFKDCVRVSGIQQETVLGIMICHQVFTEEKQKFTVTSVVDGTHKPGSFHYSGLAFDLRTYDLRGIGVLSMAQKLRDRLPSEYQIIVESDHIHVEFDDEQEALPSG